MKTLIKMDREHRFQNNSWYFRNRLIDSILKVCPFKKKSKEQLNNPQRINQFKAKRLLLIKNIPKNAKT